MERNVYIDLLKIIASILVVIWHVIDNGSNIIQLFLYMIGVYGIPIFFIIIISLLITFVMRRIPCFRKLVVFEIEICYKPKL